MSNPPVDTASILDPNARDELAVRNLDLVPRVVGRLPISIPPGLDRDDLVSVGTLGLLNAARTYQPSRGASFRTFAYMAIRAAVLDELRRYDPLPRGMRARLRGLERVESEFRAAEGRLPTPDEIAERLDLSREGAEQLLAHAQEAELLRTERRSPPEESPAHDPVDAGAVEPEQDAARREQVALVEQAVRELSQRERQVFVLYHSENLYLKEIGELLGVTESRVCQILACAQRKVRSRVEGRTQARPERRQEENEA